MWYEWVKFNEYYHHAKFDTGHIYSVRENRNVKVFATYGQSAGLTLIIKYTQIFHGSQKVHMFLKIALTGHKFALKRKANKQKQINNNSPATGDRT